MPRSSTEQQIERGLISPNTAGVLLGLSSNSVRSWIRKGHLRKMRIPFTSDTLVSALEILKIALQWRMAFKPELFEAANNYVKAYEPNHKEHMESLLAVYKVRNSQQDLHDANKEPNSPLAIILEASKNPLPTISAN